MKMSTLLVREEMTSMLLLGLLTLSVAGTGLGIISLPMQSLLLLAGMGLFSRYLAEYR